MNRRVILTLVGKDISLYFRNHFFAVVTVLALAIYVAIYVLLPPTAEAKFKIALYPPALPDVVTSALTAREMEVHPYSDVDALVTAVEAGEVRAGIVLPDGAARALLEGRAVALTAYYPPGIPAELNTAFNDLMTLVFNDISYTASNQPLRIERHEEVLGYDLAGEAIPVRDRMLPLFVMLSLMMETLGLANLITEEVERKTVRALLVTPMNMNDFLVGKSVTGVGLALIQAMILVGVTGKFGWQPLLVVAVLLLGSLLVTGVGFLVAAVSKDLMSVISWGMLAILLLGLPSATVMFPGTISPWVRVIPSYYLVDTLHRVFNFQAGWAEVVQNLLLLALASGTILITGTILLRRRLSLAGTSGERSRFPRATRRAGTGGQL